MPGSTGRSILEGALAAFPAITLEEVLAAAELQTRVDHKFLVPLTRLPELTVALGDGFSALEIDSRRAFGYESVYFDTATLDTYRDHRQGRRRRYKVRSRTYTDSATSMFEVKTKGIRGATVKHRLPVRTDETQFLTPEARGFLDDILNREYRIHAPELRPTLVSTYVRGTLVNPSAGERATLDVDLSYTHPGGVVMGPPRVLVETKSEFGKGIADRVLAAMGIRPVNISKYCVGVALSRPHLPANRWHRLLREQFGWEPSLPT